jgi:hypothetical protein
MFPAKSAFPDNKDPVAAPPQLSGNPPITLTVDFNFVGPIFWSRARTLFTARTVVPKATVHKYADALLWKCEVRSAGQRQMSTPSRNACSAKNFSDF